MPPKLDHYVGREIEALVSYVDDEPDWEWGLKISGDVVVKNLAEDIMAPLDNLAGRTISAVMQGTLGDGSAGETVVLDDSSTLEFRDGEFSVSDKNYTETEQPLPIEDLPEPSAGHGDE